MDWIMIFAIVIIVVSLLIVISGFWARRRKDK